MYVTPKLNLSAFNCPHCDAFAQQQWNSVQRSTMISGDYLPHTLVATCNHCAKFSLWIEESMVYPITNGAPNPHSDMPEDIKLDYEEARSIVSRSPRGAAALLRLAIEKLTNQLLEDEKGKNLNDNIKIMVQKGLNADIQKAADFLRVIGNNAVHPGQLDIKDNREIANSLFSLVNIVVEDRIAEPRKINSLYDSLSENTKSNIEKRDSKKIKSG